MRLFSCLAVLALLSSAAAAQPAPEGAPPPPDMQNAPPPPGGMAPGNHVPMRVRFEQANTTHDGKLTLDQAHAAHMMRIVRNFSEIDADHKGYVTWQDLRAWMAAQHGNRGGPPPQPQPQ